jgi:hypothetical protein
VSAEPFPRVAGYCPRCGQASLFLGEGGHVTCGQPYCPAPGAASEILADRQTSHVMVSDGEGFTLRHPLRERLGDELLTCQVHAALVTGRQIPAGRYLVQAGDGSYRMVRMADTS